LPGDVWHNETPEFEWHDETLVAAARLLRRIRDASAGFAPPRGASWMLVMPVDLPVEVAVSALWSSADPTRLAFRA